ATGLQIVREAFGTATTAFLATGRNFPDALAATGAAGALSAPLILVDGLRPTVSAEVMQELVRLGVTDVVLTGSASVLSSGIEAQLRAQFSVTRLGGADRYATAALINDEHFGLAPPDTMFLATGGNFPDALAGAALAGLLR